MIVDRFATASELSEPFRYFEELRSEAPVFYSDALEAYMVSTFDAVQRVLADPATFSSAPHATPNSMALHATEYRYIYDEMGALHPLPTLLVTDGVAHRRYRKALESTFSGAMVRGMEGSVRALADSLIETFIDDGRVDLNAEFCLKLPSYVICDLVGFPREAATQLKKWADTSGRLTGSSLESEEERVALHHDRAAMHLFFHGLIKRYRATPDQNLLSDLIHTVPENGVPLSDQELTSMLSTLNVGGNETTTGGLGTMFLTAARHPELEEVLRSDRAFLDRFIEEALRLDSPVAASPRWVTAETELSGVRLTKGSRLYVSMLSANLDGSKFALPKEVDVKRAGLRSHVAFGAGAHYCAGAALARLEMRVSMERVLARMQHVRVDPNIPVTHRGKLIFRSLNALPIVFDKRPADLAPAGGAYP